MFTQNPHLQPTKKPEPHVQKIKSIFEAKVLNCTIQEFFDKQKKFHKEMEQVARAFPTIQKYIPAQYRYILSELIFPYQILSKNLFHEPTGNAITDITFIKQAFNKQNADFKSALIALQESIANYDLLDSILANCRDNEQLAHTLHHELKCHSWADVYGYILKPVRHLAQTKEILKTIEKRVHELHDAHDLNLEDTITDIQEITKNFVPEIYNINDNKPKILLLKRIELILGDLLSLASRVEIDDEEENIETEINLHDKTEKFEAQSAAKPISKGTLKLSDQIQGIMLTVKTGITNIVLGHQHLNVLHSALLSLLEDLNARYIELEGFRLFSVLNYAASMGYHAFSFPFSFFSKPATTFKPIDPREELKAIIAELTELVNKADPHQDLENAIHAHEPPSIAPK